MKINSCGEWKKCTTLIYLQRFNKILVTLYNVHMGLKLLFYLFCIQIFIAVFCWKSLFFLFIEGVLFFFFFPFYRFLFMESNLKKKSTHAYL